MTTGIQLTLLAATLMTTCAAFAADDTLPRGKGILVIAHRGDSSHNPENTLASFRSAMEKKADYVELDARENADGTLWVLHDDTLDRTTDAVKQIGGKKIKLKSVKDETLRKLDSGTWFEAKFKGEKLPTLEQALDTIQKSSHTLLEHKDGAAEKYAKLLREKKLVGKLMVQSFNWEFLADLHKILPEQPLAALGGKKIEPAKLEKLPATGAKIVVWDFKELPKAAIDDLKQRGYKVWTYTVDEPKDWERLVNDGIEGIITNKPAELRAWLATHDVPRGKARPN